MVASGFDRFMAPGGSQPGVAFIEVGHQAAQGAKVHSSNDPVRGTSAIMIRTILGPATPPKSRRALFALASDALPLYHQQTKNLLVSYSPKKLGFF
ncbi:hypothetical protein [Streptomyces sp. NPDC088246]|uniref:hypothetical protein n=1 Tax=Streptomyces sp. NPDC088246 TaxID=3365842 RepID=UPI003821272C